MHVVILLKLNSSDFLFDNFKESDPELVLENDNKAMNQ